MSEAPEIGETPVFARKAEGGMDSRSVHYDAVSTDMSQAIIQEQDGWVAGSMFVSRPVQERSGKFASYPRRYYLRSSFAERGEGTESQQATWNAQFDKEWSCSVYAAKIAVGRQTIANATRPINPEQDSLEVLTQHAMLFRDQFWIGSFFDEGIWTTDLQGVPYTGLALAADEFIQWDDYLHSDPQSDVLHAQDDFRELNGLEANVMTVGRRVMTALRLHPRVKALIQYNFSGSGDKPVLVTEKTLAAIFNLRKFVVAQAIHDTHSGGEATVDPSFIAGNHALLAHAPERVNLKMPLAGLVNSWVGYESGANDMGIVVTKWYEPARKTHILEMEMAFGMMVSAPSLGIFWKDAIAG